jgi:hypothetical protein
MSEMCNCDNYSTPHKPQPRCKAPAAKEIKTDEATQPDSPSLAPTGQESETEQADLQTPASHTEGGWRSLIKVHPAAELFPMMGQDELRVLGEDIKAHGLLHDIQLLSGAVIDGRNRLDAMELVGLKFRFSKREKGDHFGSQIWVDRTVIGHCRHNTPIDIPDPARFVIEQNILRRHLTGAQKSELIGKLLKADPTKSDRAIAATAKASHVTVGTKRAAMEATGQIDQLAARTGADGKTRKQPAKSSIDPTDPLPEPLASMVDQYKAEDKEDLAKIGEACVAGILAGQALEDTPVAQRLHALMHIADDLAALIGKDENGKRERAVGMLRRAQAAIEDAFGGGAS